MGSRNYELSNHLGNVLAVISDKKIGVANTTTPTLVDYYKADVVSQNDYYPFGMQMPGRTFTVGSSYRYGVNGKEKDDEVKNKEGSQLNFDGRIYDSRGGRWLSVDPVSKPWLSSYQFAANSPTNNIDADGEDEIHFHFGSSITRGATGQGPGDSHAWVEIIKANGPDRFFHHSHITEVKLPTNFSKGGVSTFESTREFYPWNPKSRSGLTSEPVPFLSAILPDRQDRDYATLLKYVNTFPEVEKYIKSRSSTQGSSLDHENWSEVAEDRKTYSALSKITRGAEATAGVLTLVEGGLRMASSSPISVPLGDGRIFNHFTNQEGVTGITGVSAKSLSNLKVGQSMTIKQLKFGSGSNSFMANNAGDIFVTELGTNATQGQLNQIGVFGSKQGFAISFSEGTSFSQGAKVSGANPARGIYTIPGNTTIKGTFTITKTQ